MAIDTPNPNAVPAANGLLLRLKCDSIKVADVVIKRFDTNARVTHFLMFSTNISSGKTCTNQSYKIKSPVSFEEVFFISIPLFLI